MTIEYYDENAAQYFASTKDIDVENLYEAFLKELPPYSYLLDAGCGSGRDSKYFIEKGFRVHSIDGSQVLAQYATTYIGQLVHHMKFEDLDAIEEFDGIWACASLLHVARTEMIGIFSKFARALKVNGLWYVSFKWGTQDRIVDGRLFTDYNFDTFSDLIHHLSELEVVRLWKSEDLTGRNNHWLNALLRKRQ